MTFTYDGRLIYFNIEQYPTIVETVSGNVYNVRSSGLVIAAIPKAAPEAVVPKHTAPTSIANEVASEPVTDTATENAAEETATENAAEETATENAAEETATENAAEETTTENAAEETTTENAAEETATENATENAAGTELLLGAKIRPAQRYSCIISANGSHLVGEGSKEFRIDDRGRLVTLVPLAAKTWIPLLYRYAYLDSPKQKQVNPELYVISPEGAMLKILNSNETTSNYAGALILTARAHPKEITCQWYMRMIQQSMIIVLQDDAPAGSICIV